MGRTLRRCARLAAALAVLAVAAVALDRLLPPELTRYRQLSTVVVDRRGDLLRAFAAADGTWRLPTTSADVDPLYLKMLLAFEDKRFESHAGVDPLAVLRALGQWAGHGRVVSGASTLTMQAARLLEPRPRTLAAKLVEMARALQLEARLDKSQVLDIYLTLAPFGGNLEGVRSASLAYLGKEPSRLTEAEAALLVALPRAPERLRPDRYPAAAKAARDAVLARMAARGVIDAEAARRAAAEPVPAERLAFPFLAPHLAERLAGVAPSGTTDIRTTLDGALQATVEDFVHRRVAALDAETGAAVIVVHNPTMQVRVYIGAPAYFDERRRGMIDMATAVRSPGSALKPFIYGLAFDRLIVHPDTLIDDTAHDFGGYAPTNFDDEFHGEITVRDALQRSLNTPAVAVLDRLGPTRFAAALRQAGIALRFPRQGGPATLPLALGGVGLTLEDLVRLYAALSRGGEVAPLVYAPGEVAEPAAPLFNPAAAWYVARILEGVPPPAGFVTASRRAGPAVGFKTGTSFGYRDAWAIGFSGDYTIAVWVGRPDGSPCVDCIGIKTAAPILFHIADLLPPSADGGAATPPAGVVSGPTSELPPGLRRFRDDGELAASAATPDRPLAIAFPVDGSKLKVDNLDGGLAPIPLRATGGMQPLTWLVNGRPLTTGNRRWNGLWQPDSSGFAELQVIDAHGRSATAEIFIQPAHGR